MKKEDKEPEVIDLEEARQVKNLEECSASEVILTILEMMKAGEIQDIVVVATGLEGEEYWGLQEVYEDPSKLQGMLFNTMLELSHRDHLEEE